MLLPTPAPTLSEITPLSSGEPLTGNRHPSPWQLLEAQAGAFSPCGPGETTAHTAVSTTVGLKPGCEGHCHTLPPLLGGRPCSEKPFFSVKAMRPHHLPAFGVSGSAVAQLGEGSGSHLPRQRGKGQLSVNTMTPGDRMTALGDLAMTWDPSQWVTLNIYSSEYPLLLECSLRVGGMWADIEVNFSTHKNHLNHSDSGSWPNVHGVQFNSEI